MIAPDGIAIAYVGQVVARGDGRDARSVPDGERAAVGWPIAELTDPFALEVYHPIVIDDASAGLPVLPPYVRREHDAELVRLPRFDGQG